MPHSMWLDMSQYEVGTNILGDAHLANAMGAPVPTRVGSTDSGAAFSGCFRCDGPDRWVTVSVTSVKAWQGLCELVGLDEFTDRDICADTLDDATREHVATAVGRWAAPRSAEDAFAALSAAGVAASPVNNVRDLLLDPHLRERGFFWCVDHAPEQHAGMRAWPGPSARLASTPAELRARALMLGEHNREVATTLLGYAVDEYEALHAEGIFGTIPAAAKMKPTPQVLADRLKLTPAAYGRAKEIDTDVTRRMRDRFGPGYGS